MKNIITTNNTMKYYTSNELIEERDSFEKKLSESMDTVEYDKMVDYIYNKYFMNRSLLPNV